MNVLLAEANTCNMTQMVEMDNINPTMPTVDVCSVIGANDVVNPKAEEDKNSPLWGMPMVIARGTHRYRPQTLYGQRLCRGRKPAIFQKQYAHVVGDAKASIQSLVNEFKSAQG